MDKYRPKRPTTLDLFPQLPPAGTQDSINNNSLGKKDSWKESHSSSPHITDVKPKAEDKVRHSTRRPAPKPPTANEGRTKSQAVTTDARTRLRDKQASVSSSPRSQRRGGGAGGGAGGGRGKGGAAAMMKERSTVDVRGKDGVATGREDKRTGRLCAESRAKDRDKNSLQRTRDTNAAKNRGAEARAKRGAAGRTSTLPPASQEVYLPAMVVPRTPVAPRNQDKNPEPVQSHDRSQDPAPVLSRSSSEGGSNRMSLSSDTEGPPPEPLHPSVSNRTNPDISEEEAEGDPTHNSPALCVTGSDPPPQMDCTKLEVDGDGGVCVSSLNYDSVKYTLVVDEDAQLELGSLKDCLHRHHDDKDDSDAETVYQSANEDEDPEYEEERKRTEETRTQERRKEEEQPRKWRDEEVRRRREEEVKRRRDVVVSRFFRTKVTSQDQEAQTGRGGATRSRKFLNLFTDNSGHYSATGAGSFSVFSCVLDGVERPQSHRAAYRFVPRHADELHLETDDPLLLLSQSEDLWCHGYNMRTGASGVFPAFYAVKLAKENNQAHRDGRVEHFHVRFLGSVQVPVHKGSNVLCAAMHKVACNRRAAAQAPPPCVLEISVRGVKINVHDQCHSDHRGEQCFHFFQLKNISFCGCHPKHSRYFGFITKHPDQQRFACHVMMSDTTSHPLAKSLGRAFQQYIKDNISYSCPTEDIFIE
ncbi:C-Jun-amino-terminal kinase-interacting protein 1a isoform X2 [Solea solea]|uniref:C-Jun-amino-terminal kinase-interacting protein 1a isoform X2 n=1 Tax=Solea solea TaxID=90069 RepID=UPI00272B28BC|nr:C-Jun-amino-terminal kinase-interacting protein 1a isoform X2 [Solea solea]